MCSSSNDSASAAVVRRARLSTRKKLWQLDPAYHCSVIGTCLSLKELRQIAKKFDLANAGALSDYELHGLFVNSAYSPTESTRHIHKLLDKKYSQAIRQFSKAATEKDVVRLWQEALDNGNVSAAFWALLTGPEISVKLLQRIIGEVHMLSHISGASTRSDIRSLGKLRDQQKQTRESYERNAQLIEKRLRKKDAELVALRAENQRQKCIIERLEKSQQRLEELEKNGKHVQLELMVENVSGQFYKALSRANKAEQKNEALEAQLMQMETEKRSAESSMLEYRSQLNAVEATLNKILDSNCTDQCDMADTPACPLSNLSGMNILYVGGRANQTSRLKAMVEQYRGAFYYHDGGKNDGRQRLDSLLSQADTIVCPLDCISHDAFSCVKKHCDRLDKKLVMIPHASLSAFAKGLEDAAA